MRLFCSFCGSYLSNRLEICYSCLLIRKKNTDILRTILISHEDNYIGFIARIKLRILHVGGRLSEKIGEKIFKKKF